MVPPAEGEAEPRPTHAIRVNALITFLRTVHLLSAAVWLGGSVALVVVGVPAIRATEGDARANAMRMLGRRWRPLGWGSMGLAILSGLWLGSRHGAFHSAALDTRFDRWLQTGRDPAARGT